MHKQPALRLAASNPDQVNNSLASLARSCGIALRVSKGFKARYDKHGAFLGYDETGALVASIDGTPEGIAAMRSRIEGAFAPAGCGQIEAWLADLSVLAPRRNDGDGNAALVVSAYSQRLSGYPADVVREALLGRLWRFWPSWAELHEVCEDLTAQRRAVRAELDRAAAAQVERELRARALPDDLAEGRAQAEQAASRQRIAAMLADVTASLGRKAEAQRPQEDQQ